MVKVLIIGKNSFIGNNFKKFSNYADVKFISLRETKLTDISFEDYDVLLYLAAIVHQDKKVPESEYYKVNRNLCLAVAEKAKESGIKQFVFLSTIKVYGEQKINSQRPDENYPCNPDDAYGKSKYEAEIGLKALSDDKFIVSVVRTPLVYGEGVKANMLRILKLVDKFSILPFAKLSNRRSITFVGNLIGFIDRIIELRMPGTFIAMDDTPVSTTELINYIADSFNKRVYLFKLPNFILRIGYRFYPNFFNRLYGSLEFDNSITKSKLDFKVPFSTEEGIKKMVKAHININ